jgi:predicted phage baseplate assembly protein
MAIPAPNLDDRRFNDIVAEAKSLIPRYVPNWTDYNPSDPGMALLELFAWMTDLMMYRFNRVPERNYIRFLELVGIKLIPAGPARAELTFTLTGPDLVTIIIPRGTQVAAADSGGGTPLVFEIDEALIATGAKLKAVQSFDGSSYTVETTKNASDGQWFFPFGSHARDDSAMVLGFDTPASLPADQMHLAVTIFSGALAPEGRHCDLDLGALPLAASIQWEFWNGSNWKPLSLDRDETRAFTRSGHIYFRGPGTAAVKAKIGAVPDSLFWLRAHLLTSGYDTPPRVSSVLTNTVRATQAQTVRDEVLGGSDASPNQVFQLASTPVLVLDQPYSVTGAQGRLVTVTTVQVEVDEGSGFQAWQEVEDFFASGRDDPHFTLDRATGEIRFGDGRGRIPVANPANPTGNVVAHYYRWGGGKGGNVGARTLTNLSSFVEGVQDVTNLQPASGGSDDETVEEAKLRAPREIKAKDRAVTAEDFEFLTIGTPSVRIRRAKALPLSHPKYRGTPIPGVVTVIVVPDSDAQNPTPGDATLRAVCAHLNTHRLLTTEVHVVPPEYRKIKIEADLIVRGEADLSQVKHAVEDALTRFFHPLVGGNDGTGWPFGGAVFYSEVVRVVLQTAGVARVKNNNLFIWLDDERQAACTDAVLCEGELLFSEGHDIRVSYI